MKYYFLDGMKVVGDRARMGTPGDGLSVSSKCLFGLSEPEGEVIGVVSGEVLACHLWAEVAPLVGECG